MALVFVIISFTVQKNNRKCFKVIADIYRKHNVDKLWWDRVVSNDLICICRQMNLKLLSMRLTNYLSLAYYLKNINLYLIKEACSALKEALFINVALAKICWPCCQTETWCHAEDFLLSLVIWWINQWKRFIAMRQWSILLNLLLRKNVWTVRIVLHAKAALNVWTLRKRIHITARMLIATNDKQPTKWAACFCSYILKMYALRMKTW